MPRARLDERIAARVAGMWQAGLVAEVRGLAEAGLRDGKTASRALGYAQVLRFLDGQWSQEEAAAETVKATRRFARRQLSWFRRDPRITWLPAGRDRIWLVVQWLRSDHAVCQGPRNGQRLPDPARPR